MFATRKKNVEVGSRRIPGSLRLAERTVHRTKTSVEESRVRVSVERVRRLRSFDGSYASTGHGDSSSLVKRGQSNIAPRATKNLNRGKRFR